MEHITFPTRVFKRLGVETVVCEYNFYFYDRLIYSGMYTKINTWLVVTNAAGGLNSDYNVGDITLLNDVRLSSFTENIPTSLIRSSIFSWRALQVFIR